MEALLALGQGIYYLLTGLWPLFHISSFEKVTGPKTDRWLVKTVGALVSVGGVVLLYSGLHPPVPAETIILAVGSALALSLIDIVYSLKGRIRRIYLADAAAELALAAAWVLAR